MPALLMMTLLAAAAPIRLAAPKMQTVNLDPKVAEAIAGQLAQQLAVQPGLKVTTPEEISSLLGLDRQKQLLGCTAETCTAELAGALGVDVVILSSVSFAGSSYLLNVKAIGAKDASQLAVISQRVASIDALLDAMNLAARQIALELHQALRPNDAVAVVATPVVGERSTKAWIPGVVGGALMLGGGVLYGLSRLEEARVRAGDPADVDATIAAGKTEQGVGVALFVTGAAAVAGAALWALVFAGSPVQATVGLTPHSAGVVVVGRFP